MKTLKIILKVWVGLVLVLLLLIAGMGIYVWQIPDSKPPGIPDKQVLLLKRVSVDTGIYAIGNNWLKRNRYGLYEMYLTGSAFERGVINGKLSQELLIKQEEAFTDQIKTMVPSKRYLGFLKYVIRFMNRNLDKHIKQEYKEEIFGISLAASDRFQWIGDNYSRQLNYHAAHDIGHALQNMMLVGCTSFGAWSDKTADGSMILGRNFDFWVGDEFAENKIVEFVKPDRGHSFAFITWGGFIGVVSGMNEKGLTVTINAARSSIPNDAATPVSLVAREILQYAANIEEAVAIAHSREMFVSESFLIGSAADRKSVVIEKTPDTLAIYDPAEDAILCTNHYQSELLSKQGLNQAQMESSASVYRYDRLLELLQDNYPLTPAKVADILRDTRGLKGKNIGLGNEKAVNQLIAHHAVIFMPDSLRMWVSTSPWQMGEFVCYDLRKVFLEPGFEVNRSAADTLYNIPADPFLKSPEFVNYLSFRDRKMQGLNPDSVIDVKRFIGYNPEFYDAYRLVGDYFRKRGEKRKAAYYYRMALSKEIATADERLSVQEKLDEMVKVK